MSFFAFIVILQGTSTFYYTNFTVLTNHFVNYSKYYNNAKIIR